MVRSEEWKENILKKILRYECPAAGFGRYLAKAMPVIIEKGKGAWIQDVDGKKYIDLAGGWGSLNVGNCHPKVANAVIDQVKKLVGGWTHATIPRAELMEKLSNLAPGGLKGGKIAFSQSGSETNEAALKLTRFTTEKTEIVSFYGSFLGTTHGPLSMNGGPWGRGSKKKLHPLVPGILWVPWAYCYRCSFKLTYPDCDVFCAKFVEEFFNDPRSPLSEPAGIITEPMQGAGGLIVPPNKFLQTLRKICDKEGIPLIFDEVLTAWGRTGKLFGCQHSGVTPDIMGWGKSIAGGIPGISAIIAKEELMDKWAEGVHGSTFGGNPLSCRAALAALEVIEEEKLVDNSARLGDYLMKALKDLAKEHPTMGDIRGKGLFIGIEMVKDRDTKEPYSEAAFNIQRELQKGEPGVLMIIVGPSKNILRLLPPLVIKKEEVDMVIDQLQVILTKLKL